MAYVFCSIFMIISSAAAFSYSGSLDIGGALMGTLFCLISLNSGIALLKGRKIFRPKPDSIMADIYEEESVRSLLGLFAVLFSVFTFVLILYGYK